MITTKTSILENLRALPESHILSTHHRDIIRTLWTELGSNDGESKHAAKIMLSYIYIFRAPEEFIQLVDESYLNQPWEKQFDLANKLASLLQHVEPSAIIRCPVVCYAVSYCVFALLDLSSSPVPSLNRRVKFLCDTFSKKSLLAICSCFEFQYRNILRDRCIIFKRIEQLHLLRPDAKLLNWGFFNQSLILFSVEAQVCKDLGLNFCIPLKLLYPVTSFSNQHYATSMENRQSPNGIPTGCYSIAEKWTSTKALRSKKMTK
ncbi:Oidioi.mRNA.OKI2018_I69.XSR.g16074.t1.cds [Oikopleura dioica]|uniref:Oidioi.mRNA.OKI2018_I69.XSR.g16074.t1.cds n=1 Tax=Oikopleura dioica TaxID=34765 RepID=A0ABN7SJZ8_OIKDI|nr:Oidioi.mRNA.OKI2018_I69.XSR.g16074.t1.cds [Oikopleura dioica]